MKVIVVERMAQQSGQSGAIAIPGAVLAAEPRQMAFRNPPVPAQDASDVDMLDASEVASNPATAHLPLHSHSSAQPAVSELASNQFASLPPHSLASAAQLDILP